jgi:hypothetical protein
MEQFGAGSGAEGVETGPETSLELIGRIIGDYGVTRTNLPRGALLGSCPQDLLCASNRHPGFCMRRNVDQSRRATQLPP